MRPQWILFVAFIFSFLCSPAFAEEFNESNNSLQSESGNSNMIEKKSPVLSAQEEFAGRQELLHRRVERGKEAEDDRKLVTVDLSALRPSLPGLVLFKYGDQAPKLVQVDIATLNPLIQPHVIWPQFHQQKDTLEALPFDALEDEEIESIPYLGRDKSLTPKQQPQRMAKMTSAEMSSDWPDLNDLADGDIYDFIPNSFRNEELMTLHDSLPLAEEIIIPLDWEQSEHNQHQGKRDLLLSHGWKPGDVIKSRDKYPVPRASSRDHNSIHQDIHYTSLSGSSGWRPARKKDLIPKVYNPHRRHPGVESEAIENPRKLGLGKKNVFFTKGWGPGGRSLTELESRRPGSTQKQASESHSTRQKNGDNNLERISGQESWSVPRQHWNVPQLFGMHW